MNARDHILTNIRAKLGRAVEESAQADARLGERPAGPIPAQACGTAEELRQRFIGKARKASADVEELADLFALPQVVGRLCDAHGFDRRVVVAPDSVFNSLDWQAADVTVERRAAGGDDRVCVSRAVCGIAETGTLALASGPASPVTLNFLPDLHIVALDGAAIVGGYEAAWQRLREIGAMPRSINWITGPSRSADIEQTLQLGAHGPVRLVVALF